MLVDIILCRYTQEFRLRGHFDIKRMKKRSLINTTLNEFSFVHTCVCYNKYYIGSIILCDSVTHILNAFFFYNNPVIIKIRINTQEKLNVYTCTGTYNIDYCK